MEKRKKKKTFTCKARESLHYFTAEEGKNFNQKHGTTSKEQTDRDSLPSH